MRHCIYCEKEMTAEKDEEYRTVYRCHCSGYLKEQELLMKIADNKREGMQLKTQLWEQQKKSKLSQKIIKINGKFGTSFTCSKGESYE